MATKNIVREAVKQTRAEEKFNRSKMEKKQKETQSAYAKEKRVPISIPPMYAPYFGNNLRVSINCVSIVVPCNGKTVKVPVTFAREIKGRLAAKDKMLRMQRGLKDTTGIYERSPGDIPLK